MVQRDQTDYIPISLLIIVNSYLFKEYVHIQMGKNMTKKRDSPKNIITWANFPLHLVEMFQCLGIWLEVDKLRVYYNRPLSKYYTDFLRCARHMLSWASGNRRWLCQGRSRLKWKIIPGNIKIVFHHCLCGIYWISKIGNVRYGNVYYRIESLRG